MISFGQAMMWAVFVVLGGLAIALMASTDPNPDTAVNAAEASGVDSARVIESGYVTLRCGKGDDYYYRVAGKRNGHDVTVTVCCGLLKDCTIRY